MLVQDKVAEGYKEYHTGRGRNHASKGVSRVEISKGQVYEVEDQGAVVELWGLKYKVLP